MNPEWAASTWAETIRSRRACGLRSRATTLVDGRAGKRLRSQGKRAAAAAQQGPQGAQHVRAPYVPVLRVEAEVLHFRLEAYLLEAGRHPPGRLLLPLGGGATRKAAKGLDVR